MPYSQAFTILANPNSTLSELLEAFEDAINEYIYLATVSGYESKAGQKLREGVAEDLLRLLVLKKALKVQIERKASKIMTIQAKVATILKAKLLPSEKLATTEKFSIYKGEALQVKSIAPAPHQHLVVDLVNAPISRGYLYAPHWNYEQEKIILDATYYYQTDNPSGEGSRECCGTSNAILLNYLLKGKLDADAKREGVSQPEWIYLKALREEGDTTDHDANTRTLKKFGIDSYWSTSLGFDDYFLSIRNGIPMVMGTDYKAGGHVICGIGFDLIARKIIVHDPYGAREGSTDYWISNLPEAGKFDEYQIGTMTKNWMPDGQAWGRIVTHINGVKTVFAD